MDDRSRGTPGETHTSAASGPAAAAAAADEAATAPQRLNRSLALVGLMGAGKSVVGRRLAQRLGLPFIDADTAIEAAAGCSISDFFARYGEPAFRDGEAKVIARLLDGPPCVLATGGGAYMNPATRARIRKAGLAVWLKADLDTLVRRTAGRGHRPLLHGRDHRAVLEDLMAVRYPVYAEADITIDLIEEGPEATTARVLAALEHRLGHPLTVEPAE